MPSPIAHGLAGLADALNVDTHPPIGLMALWPLSDGYSKSPIPVFLDIGRTLTWTTVRNNAVAGAWELVVLLPILVVSWRYKARQLGGLRWHVGSKASP